MNRAAVVDYIVLVSRDEPGLRELVVARLSRGWELQGGVSQAVMYNAREFSQAMVQHATPVEQIKRGRSIEDAAEDGPLAQPDQEDFKVSQRQRWAASFFSAQNKRLSI